MGNKKKEKGGGGCDLYPFRYLQCLNAAYNPATAGFVSEPKPHTRYLAEGALAYRCTGIATCDPFVTLGSWLW